MKLKEGWQEERAKNPDAFPKTWRVREEDGELLCQMCDNPERPATSFFMNYMIPVCEEHRDVTHGFFDFNDRGHGRPGHKCDDKCLGKTIGAKDGDAVITF